MTRHLFSFSKNLVQDSVHQLQSNILMFKPHGTKESIKPSTISTRECMSVYFSGYSDIIDQYNENFNIEIENIKILNKTWDLIKLARNNINGTGPKQILGRSYITILDTNKIVYPHIDIGLYHNNVDRYQIYLMVPPILAKIENDHTITEGDCLLFSANKLHGYHNNSDTPLIVIVFDLFKN